MNSLNQYQSSAADWRKQLQINDRRTKIVIFLFIAIYVCIGLIIDVDFRSNLYYQLSLSQTLYLLITFKIIPYATLILAGVAGFSLFLTFSLHDKIMMLGTDHYEVTPETAHSLPEQQLLNIVGELKIAAGLTYLPKVYIIEADYMNAFASGYSEKSALVAITRGLLSKLNRSELQAVLAHELSHIRHHDIKLTLFAVVLSNIMLIVIDMLFYSVLYGGGGDRRRRDDRLLVIVLLLRYILPLVTVLLLLYLSRTREYMADAGAVELLRDNSPLASALLKINSDTENHQDLYQQKYQQTANEHLRLAAYIYDPAQAGINIRQAMTSLFSTHPSLEDRLQALGFVGKK